VPDVDDLLARVHDALAGHLALGNEVIDDPLARFVRNASTPDVYDANHATSVRASTPEDIDAVLARSDELFPASRHRRYFVDPWTPTAFEARLALDDYVPSGEVTLLLDGELERAAGDAPPGLELRLAESDDDWASFTRLLRLDHEEEEATRASPRSAGFTAQMAATKRAKTAHGLRFWIARVDGTDCAFFSSWGSTRGIGIVEDLFTHPDFRHRGVATALIVHCIDDARAQGAGPVIISALVDDTPKHMYAAFGFRPFLVHRSYLRTQPRSS
jgi:GNAT superfamily N-acetyltransferase